MVIWTRQVVCRWAVLATALVCASSHAPSAAGQQQKPRSQEKTVGVWMSPGGPWGIWEKDRGNPFPAERIVGDLADLGVSDILFFEQAGRGGQFLHPTSVEHAVTEPRMKGRDFLGELLQECDRHGIRVWLAWTPPGGKYPGTQFSGLNHPAILKLYVDEIEEVAARYAGRRSLAGIVWHEVDCSEAPDLHEDDVAEFSAFCERRFGEKYAAAKMPQVDPDDRWWRRFFLYKIDIVNHLVRTTAEAARKHGLATHFCSYVPEAFAGESWRWGYDVVALEDLCDRQWFSGYALESGKPYQTIRGAWLDFGPSYRGQILARNYAYAFHGRPLCYFEYRTPVYLDEMRKFYSRLKDFTEKYGDFYTGYGGRSEQELSLYFGRENLKHWLALMTRWQGGRSAARVAVAVHPNPFIMKHPQRTGVEYDKRVRSLILGLGGTLDVDGVVLGSRFALDPANLLQYAMLIIPEDMGEGLSPPVAESLRTYVAKGGKLLVLSTPLTTARPDLTDPSDLTREFCGLEITGPGLPGYLAPAGTTIPKDVQPFWATSSTAVRLCGAQVLAVRRAGGAPLLVQHGNVTFSTIGYSPEGRNYFAAVVKDLCRPPITLSENSGLRILESVAKDGTVCLPLWGQGKAVLHVDAAQLGLPGSRLRVKDIVTGTSLGDFSPAQLQSGAAVQVKHLYQPLVLAVGSAEALDEFKGIYPSPEVFAGMAPKVALENPEVPHESSSPAGAAASRGDVRAASVARDKEIGILDHAARYDVPYKRSSVKAHEACLKLVREAGLTPETMDVDVFLPQNKAQRDRYKRLLIPAASDYFTQAMYEGMDDYVASGGLLLANSSLLLLDKNANYRVDEGEGATDFSQNRFLGVYGHGSCTMHRLKVLQECPLTVGLAPHTWTALESPAAGRQTRNHSADVVILSDRVVRDAPDGDQPFLTYRHQGNGAAIYLVGQFGPTNDRLLVQLLRNLLSPATLQWLCAP